LGRKKFGTKMEIKEEIGENHLPISLITKVEDPEDPSIWLQNQILYS